MKLLIISDAWKPQINGVVRTYEYLITELAPKGHDIHVIGPEDFSYTIALPNYPEIRLVIGAYKKLSDMITTYKPEAIHIATEGPLGRAAKKYCQKHNLKFTSCYHTHFPDYVAKRVAKIFPWAASGVKNLVFADMRKFHKNSSAIFVATQSLEDELRSRGFEAPIKRLSRGARLDLFYPPQDNRQKEVFEKELVALYVGRIAIEKNLEDFLSLPWPENKVLIGDGPDLEKLKLKYPQAAFLGKKTGEALAHEYQKADLFVFPSKTDTFGMVLLEALACGLPVAAYDVGGPADIITEPFLGALEKEDLQMACKRAVEFKSSPEQRYEFVKKHYSWPEVAQSFMGVVEEVGI